MNPLRISLPATFIIILAICQAVGMPIHDYDYFWHLKTGEWIATHNWTLPAAEPFAFTTSSARWIVQGWLFDVVQYEIHKEFGETGVRLMFTAISIATLRLIYASARLYLPDESRPLILTALCASAAAPYLSARPMVATNLAFAFVLFALLKYRRTARRAWLATLPPAFALWVNLHFGYVTGLALIGLFAGAALLERRVVIAQAPRESGDLSLSLTCAVLLASLAAICVNPYGWHALTETVQMTRVNMQTQVIEWRSPEFRMWHTWPFLAAMGVLFIGRTLAAQRAQWLDLMAPMALIGAALMSQRHTPLACIAMAPMMARALASWPPGTLDLRLGARWAAGWRSSAGKDLGNGQYVLNGMLILLTALAAVIVQPAVSARLACDLRRELPAAAADFVLAQGLSGPLFNDYHTGGYLIHRLYPRVPVFIDGRYNPFTGAVMNDYEAITKLREGWQERLDHYGIALAILALPNQGLAGAMMASGRFRLVYADKQFRVLIRHDGAHPALPTVSLPAADSPDRSEPGAARLCQ